MGGHMLKRVVLVALLVALAGYPAFAQQGTSEIRGVVRDQQGAVLPGATITVRNQDTGMFREAVTNADGTYFVSAIVPGRYEVAASLEGFRPHTQRDLIVQLG